MAKVNNKLPSQSRQSAKAAPYVVPPRMTPRQWYDWHMEQFEEARQIQDAPERRRTCLAWVLIAQTKLRLTSLSLLSVQDLEWVGEATKKLAGMRQMWEEYAKLK